uniref:Gustatory receptor n=1 Tax=Tetranychus urticae TaxID=32264 RepID=T1KAL2_TETUR
MNQVVTINGRVSCSKPRGVYATMLRFDGKKSNLIHFLLIIAAIYTVLASGIQNRTQLEWYETCFQRLTLTLHGIWLLMVRFKRWQYIELIEIFESQTRCNLDSSQAHRHFVKIRTTFYYFCAFIAFSVMFMIYYYPVMTFLDSNDYFQLVKSLLLKSLTAITLVSYLSYLQFIVESCLHIHACWFAVIERIHSLKKTDSRSLTSDEILEVRSMYSIAAVVTEKMDSFLRLPIFYFCSLYIITYFILLVQFWHKPNIVGFLRLAIRFANLFLVIWNMTYIHYLSTQCFHDVYSLSYEKHSSQVNDEIHLFLDRIAQSNVGFSFLKVSLITPTFITSLASLNLTFVLALPSLL